jgi:hypothetical protein
VNMIVNGTRVTRSLGVDKAAGHTAKAQFNGYLKSFESCIDMLKASPLGTQFDVDLQKLAAKMCGLGTDHAADQKLLAKFFQDWKRRVDRETRGEAFFAELPEEERARAAADALNTAISSTCGWHILSPTHQDAIVAEIWRATIIAAGEKRFEDLTAEERSDIDLFVWHGCMMHKDLNATKGGVKHMRGGWEKHGLTPPIPLKNIYEAAGAEVPEDSRTRESADDHASGVAGAVRLTSLAGALFNHKHDEKGIHNVARDWFFEMVGVACVFPDTSNTRYGSHCDAAIELLLNHELHLELMECIRTSKTRPGLNHMEQNIKDGLQDPSTLTELAVLAIYAQSVSRPYMAYVRSYRGNALDLGPFHEQLKVHIRKLIANTDLLLTPDASARDAAFLGAPWGCLEVMQHIWDSPDTYPNLDVLLVEFLEGALETWDRFISEFAEDGGIVGLTTLQLGRAFALSTNCICEGDLAQTKEALVKAPTVTDHQRKAAAMGKFNKTDEWTAENGTPEFFEWSREQARIEDASGKAARVRTEMVQAQNEKAAEGAAKEAQSIARKAAFVQKLTDTPWTARSELHTLRDSDLGNLIDKWRQVDKQVPAKSKLKRLEKIGEIEAAMDRKADAQAATSGEDVEMGEPSGQVA